MFLGLGLTLSRAHSRAGVLVSVPVNSVAPAVTGSQIVGQTLTTDNGTWSNSPTGYTYQWKRDGVDIGSATSSTYLLVTADGGKAVTCAVTASNAGGSGTPAVSNSLRIFSLGYEIGPAGVVSTSGNSITLTTTAAIAAGDMVVIGMRSSSATQVPTTVSDNSGDTTNSWVANTAQSSGGNTVRMYYKKATAPWAIGTVITGLYGTTVTTTRQLLGVAFSGANTIDQSITGSTATSTAPAVTYGALASTPEMGVVFILTGVQSGGFPPLTQPAGFSVSSTSGNLTQLSTGLISNAGGATLTFTGANVIWWTQMMSFTAAP